MKEIDPSKKISDIVMFDGASNVQLAGILLKVHYPKLTLMCCVEHTVSLLGLNYSWNVLSNFLMNSHL